MPLRARKRRKRLSMTSLIDVIFLLLLFFMLSSTFSRFAEVELNAGSGGAAAKTPPENLLFLRLTQDGMTLNGAPIDKAAIQDRLAKVQNGALLISVANDATAQTLTDVLVLTRGLPDLPVTVLGAS